MEKVDVIKKVKTLLGAPMVAIELTDEFIGDLYEMATEDFEMYAELSKRGQSTLRKIKSNWTRRYTVALAKEALGRIRGKFNGQVPIPGQESLTLDSDILLAEAYNEKLALENMF